MDPLSMAHAAVDAKPFWEIKGAELVQAERGTWIVVPVGDGRTYWGAVDDLAEEPRMMDTPRRLRPRCECAVQEVPGVSARVRWWVLAALVVLFAAALAGVRL